MNINIIAHAVGTTPSSIFAIEFIGDEESDTYYYNPTGYTKHNPLFNPFLSGGKKINPVALTKRYPVGTKFFATAANKKLLGHAWDGLLLAGKKVESLLEPPEELRVGPPEELRVGPGAQPQFIVNE